MALRVQDRAGTIFCTHEADSAADYANAPNGVTIWTLNGEIVRKTASGVIVPLFTEQGTNAGGTGTGTFSGVEEEVFTSTPYTTLAPTTLKNIINVFWNGWPQERPNTGNTIGDYDHTVNPNGTLTINGDPMQVGGGRGKIIYIATGAATALPTPPAPTSQQVDDAKDVWIIPLVPGYDQIHHYEYDQTNTVATTPTAPTGAVTDDAANTFDWTNNPTYPNIADYEYTMNGGTSYANVTAKPQPVGNVALAIGQVGVRVKAGTNTTASATLFNTVAFTVVAVAPTVYHLSEFTGPAGTLWNDYVPNVGAGWVTRPTFPSNETLDGTGNVQFPQTALYIRDLLNFTQADTITEVVLAEIPATANFQMATRVVGGDYIGGMVTAQAGSYGVAVMVNGAAVGSQIVTYAPGAALRVTMNGGNIQATYNGVTVSHTTAVLTCEKMLFVNDSAAGLKIGDIKITSI